MTTTVRPRTPAELAVLLPYQLGYHPGPSVVVTLLRGKRLGLVQRHDLLHDPDDCREAAQQAMAIAAREGATSVIVIAHEEDEGGSAPLRVAMVDAAAREGIAVHEDVVVRGGRWYGPDCDQACCPQEGLPLPEPRDVPAVAAYVHAGVAPLPSRDALVSGVLPARDEERSAAVGLHLTTLGSSSATRSFGGASPRPPRSWVDRGDEVLEWWTRVLDPRPEAVPVADLPDEALAWIAVSMQDVVWRDALMGILCPGSMPMTESWSLRTDAAVVAAYWCPWVPSGAMGFADELADDDLLDGLVDERVPAGGGPVGGDVVAPQVWHDEVLAVRARLVELTRLLPAGATASLMTLVAHLAWWMGDGTVAGVCLERALEIDPDHRLAQLMLQLLSVGVRPWDGPDVAGPADAA